MQKLRVALLAALALVFSTADLSAQVNATGTFSGQVTDPIGATVSNAQVKVTDQETGIVPTKQTGTDGYFKEPLLKPGPYSIEVSIAGFTTAVRRDVVLQIQQVIQEDFKLQVGNMQQEVT